MKPSVSSVLGRFRRKSVPARTDFTRGDRPFEPTLATESTLLRSKSAVDASTSLQQDNPYFFSLPTEIYVQILLELQFRDLCNFRAVNTRARDLLSEGEIIRRWIIQYADQQQLKLYAPEPTFQYLFDEQKRHQTATELATLLADYIEREILRYTLLQRDDYPIRKLEVFETVKSQLKERMVPLILTVQHYLTQSASILLDALATSSDDYRTSYRSREHQIFESHEPKHLHLAHKLWMFLLWLSDQILHRPSYAGTFERTVRGWSMEPLDRFAYRRFLVFGNVDALTTLIRVGTPKQRRKVMDTFLSRLDPDRNAVWQQYLWRIPAACGKQVTEGQMKRILGLELTATDIWVESAQAILIAKEEISPQENAPIGTPWQVMDFLCDLAGYDVLHLPPSMQ